MSYANGWTQTLQVPAPLGIEYSICSDYSKDSERCASCTAFSRSDVRPVLSSENMPTQPGRYYNGEVNTRLPDGFDENGIRLRYRCFGLPLDRAAAQRHRHAPAATAAAR